MPREWIKSSLGPVDEMMSSVYVPLRDQYMEGDADDRTLAPHRRRLG